MKYSVAIVLLFLAKYSAAEVPVSHPELLKGVTEIGTDANLNEWMTYYYLHPRPDLALSALNYISSKGFLKKGSATSPMNEVFAQILVQNPDKTSAWVKTIIKKSEDQKMVFANALWLSRLPDSDHLIQEISEGGSPGFQKYLTDLRADKNPPDLSKVPVSDAGVLDLFWASFSVTGEKQYVIRVIDALPLAKAKDAASLVIGSAAEWSLISQAQQHPTVLKICKEELKSASGDKKKLLQDVISKASKQAK